MMSGTAGRRPSIRASIRHPVRPVLASISFACICLFSAKSALADPQALCPAGYPKSFCSTAAASHGRHAPGARPYRRFGLPGGVRQAPLDSSISAAAVAEEPTWMPAPKASGEPEFVSRIRGLDDLAVVTFWKTEGAKIYMGLEDGRPGIHLKQILPDSGD
jgi:hypothetical protein